MLTTTTFVPTGTNFFRLSARKLLDRWGSNLQNNNARLSACLTPPPGQRVVSADQAGAEALCFAYMARPGKFRRLFELEVKPHTYMGLQIFMDRFIDNDQDKTYLTFCEPDDLVAYHSWSALNKTVKKSGVPYDTGKRVIHADNYGMGTGTYLDYTLKESDGEVQLTKAEGDRHLGLKATLFPEIGELKHELIAECKTNRVMTNLLGYPIRFTRPWNLAMERKALACIPQSTVGCISHLAVNRMYYEDIVKDKRDWTIINNKHDSFAVFCRPEEEKEVAHKMMNYLCVDLEYKGTKFKMKAEVSAGWNFGKFDPVTNPGGLQELELN